MARGMGWASKNGLRGRIVKFPLFGLPAITLIDGGRLLLGAVALLTVLIDPLQPARAALIGHDLLVAYVGFAAVLLIVPPDRKRAGPVQLLVHAVDIAVFTVLMQLSEGPTGRVFPFYNFALIAATLRWSWRGALATSLLLVALTVVTTYLGPATSAAAPHLPVRLAMRAANLLVVGVLLACLGAYLEMSRDRLGHLAAWPREDLGEGATPALAATLAHARSVIGSNGIVVAWETGEEPFLRTVRSTAEACAVACRPEKRLGDLTVPELDGISFYAARPDAGRVTLASGGWSVAGPVLDGDIAAQIAGTPFCSAPFEGRDVAGRIFILHPGPFTPALLHLCEIVGGRIGAELEEFGLRSALATAASLRERARLARDLHDGLLQDLTAARLTIKALTQSAAEPRRDNLEEIAGMLGDHQRRLRDFVRAANPKPAGEWDFGAEFLTLTAMLERQWHCKVVAALNPPGLILPGGLGYQVFLIFGEAMANAVQHGRSQQIAVAIEKRATLLRMVISDDGCGLPQRPAGNDPGPFSLRQRVAELGGRLELASSASGVALTIELPIA